MFADLDLPFGEFGGDGRDFVDDGEGEELCEFVDDGEVAEETVGGGDGVEGFDEGVFEGWFGEGAGVVS